VLSWKRIVRLRELYKVGNNKPLNSGEKADRDKKGRFIEGNIPKGHRKKGTKNYLTLLELTLLEEALREEAKKANKTYWQKLAEWCFTSPNMAVAVLKKFVPDKQHTEISGIEPLKFEVEILNGNKKSESK